MNHGTHKALCSGLHQCTSIALPKPFRRLGKWERARKGRVGEGGELVNLFHIRYRNSLWVTLLPFRVSYFLYCICTHSNEEIQAFVTINHEAFLK